MRLWSFATGPAMDMRQLFIAQPALSQQMARLEDEVELFVILPVASTLAAALPLILPSPGHGLRRRIALEFERVGLPLDARAEVDSLPLLMHCVAQGMGATIKPMAAVHALGDQPEQWRCLRVSDAAMTRANYLYALPPQKLSPRGADRRPGHHRDGDRRLSGVPVAGGYGNGRPGPCVPCARAERYAYRSTICAFTLGSPCQAGMLSTFDCRCAICSIKASRAAPSLAACAGGRFQS